MNRRDNTSEFNLIDLSDFVQVPQSSNIKDRQIEKYQMKMLEEFCSTSHTKNEHGIDDAQLASFFDKYDNHTHVQLNSEDFFNFKQDAGKSNIGNEMGKVNEKLTKVNLNEDSNPRVPIPKIDIKNHEKEIDEDLIDNVMYQQQIEKEIYNSTNKKDNEIPHTSRTNKNEHSKDVGDILDEIINKNKIIHTSKPTANVNISNKAKVQDNFNNTSEKTQERALIRELVTRYDIKYLETVKKNDKIYRSSAFKPDHEKINLTVGPNLYEKAVVLPQIMQRMREIQKEEEDRSRLPKKLILDGSGSSNKHLSDPIVLMADCNKERLRAWESAKMLNRF